MSPDPTGVMFTRTATAPAAVQKTLRGFGDQPRLLAHSIMARPRQHSVIETYMTRLPTRLDRCGAPRSRATEVSGRSTGGVATLGAGAVAHRPTNATPPRPSAVRITAGDGRGRGAVREHPDELAHEGLDAPAGERRLGQPVFTGFAGLGRQECLLGHDGRR